MNAFLAALYGFPVFVALTNWLLMRRPGPVESNFRPAICIPARNEIKNIGALVRTLVQQGGRVYVFDDESSDGTAEAAADAGATVIRASAPLPEGWTGKNRACHELAKVVAEDFEGDYLLFLDADLFPKPDFIDRFGTIARGSAAPVVSAMPQLLPGRGFEPAYLSWVAWSLMALNPFGLVTRLGAGHNRALNGQIVCWKRDTYYEILPHLECRNAILEDILIGRLLAKRGIRVEIANVSSILAVRMYETFSEALDGMSKNSCYIMGNAVGTIFLSLLWLLFGWGWALGGPMWLTFFLMLSLSKLIVDLAGRIPLWTTLLMPITMTLAAWTLWRSMVWKHQKRIRWKDRLYP